MNADTEERPKSPVTPNLEIYNVLDELLILTYL